MDDLVRELREVAMEAAQRKDHEAGGLIWKAADAIEALTQERDAALAENHNMGEALTRKNEKTAVLEKRLAGVEKALERIMYAVKDPPFTNMSRAGMREIAAAALATKETP